jgi:hypothetical protein
MSDAARGKKKHHLNEVVCRWCVIGWRSVFSLQECVNMPLGRLPTKVLALNKKLELWLFVVGASRERRAQLGASSIFTPG